MKGETTSDLRGEEGFALKGGTLSSRVVTGSLEVVALVVALGPSGSRCFFFFAFEVGEVIFVVAGVLSFG